MATLYFSAKRILGFWILSLAFQDSHLSVNAVQQPVAPSTQPASQPAGPPDFGLTTITDPFDVRHYQHFVSPIPTPEQVIGAMRRLSDSHKKPRDKTALVAQENLDRYASLLDELLHGKSDDPSSSVQTADRLCEFCKQAFGPHHWRTRDAALDASSLKRAASLFPNHWKALCEIRNREERLQTLFASGRMEEAATLVREHCRQLIEIAGKDHPWVGSALLDLGFTLGTPENRPEAARCFIRALEIFDAFDWRDHPEFARGLRGYGWLLYELGRREEAKDALGKTLLMRCEFLGPNDPGLYQSARDFSGLLREAGDLSAATAALDCALSLYQKSNQKSPDVAAGLEYSLASIKRSMGELPDAERLFQNAMKVFSRPEVNNKGAIVACVNNIGLLRKEQGDLVGAADFLKRAAQTYRVLNDPVGECAARGNLVCVYIGMGELQLAEPEAREGMRAARRAAQETPIALSESLVNLADVLFRKGDLGEARRLYGQALTNQTTSLGEGHASTVKTSECLAMTLRNLGELDEAENLQRSVLQRLVKQFGDTHPHVATVRNNLAVTLLMKDGFIEAEDQLLKAQEVYSAMSEESARDLIEVWHNLAAVRAHRSDFAGAESFLRKAVEREQRLGLASDHGHKGILADLLRRQPGRVAEARVLVEEEIAGVVMRDNSVFGDELDQARYRKRLIRMDPFGGAIRAWLTSNIGDDSAQPDRAFDALERGRGRALLDLIGRREASAPQLASSIDEPMRSGFIQRLEQSRNRLNRGLSDVATIDRRIAILDRDVSALAEKKEELKNLRYARRQASEATRLAQQEVYEGLRAGFTFRGLEPLKISDIRGLLRADEVLLAYSLSDQDAILLVVRRNKPVQGFFLKWDDGTPVTSAEVAKKTQVMFKTGSAGSTDVINEVAASRSLFHALIPEDLVAVLRSSKRVLIVPDGPLWGLPFDAIHWPDTEDTRWIDRGPPIVYGPSATLLMNRRRIGNARAEPGSTPRIALVAVGDPVFGQPFPEAEAAPAGVVITKVLPNSAAARAGLFAGDVITEIAGESIRSVSELQKVWGAVTSGSSNSAKDKTPNIDRRQEVSATIWRRGQELNPRIEAANRLGIQASQDAASEALVDLAVNDMVEADRVAYWQERSCRGAVGPLAALPGTRHEVEAVGALVSGPGGEGRIEILLGPEATESNLFSRLDGPRFLLLATHARPANGMKIYESTLALTTPDVPSATDDGFLRLDELLYSWGGKLRGTELVVLSACQSATGPILDGEGFVALTWGFFFAGADSVVASLWKVNDNAAALLMCRFFENRLGRFSEARHGHSAATAMSKADALSEAKVWLSRNSPDQNRRRLKEMGFNLAEIESGKERSGIRPTSNPVTLRDPYDYSDPWFWAAFVLIGDAD